jgi:hypothetical protein
MKRILGSLYVALLLLGLALPTLAQKPTIQLIPFTSVFVPAAAGCGFDLLVTPQAGRPNRERLIQFANSTIIAGPLFVTVKNLGTAKTITLNISGPQRTSFSGTTGTTTVEQSGAFVAPLPAGVAAAAGLPILPLIHGRIVFTLDQQGNVTAVQSVTGTVQDLCQLLQ